MKFIKINEVKVNDIIFISDHLIEILEIEKRDKPYQYDKDRFVDCYKVIANTISPDPLFAWNNEEFKIHKLKREYVIDMSSAIVLIERNE